MNKRKKALSFTLFSVFMMMILIVSIHSKASAGAVTGYQKITWGISTGRYYVNEIHAFCAQYNKTWPLVGTEVTEIVPCTNEILRKALYYGYNGPQNVLGTDDKAHVLTAIAVSDANIGESETGASATYDAFYWELINNSESYPSPPSNFKAYLAITASDEMQNLAFYVMEKNGYVQGNKTSSNSELNQENNCYSFEGAQYGIYTESTATEASRVGTLTTDANGNTNVVELQAGTYYAYELKAPKGFAKSEEVISFEVTAEQTTTIYFQDIPQTNQMGIVLEKVDADTGENKPQGSASLKGARFSVQYFAGIWKEGINPASLGVAPRRTWIFETDENGVVKYDSEYKVSGDELYVSVPLGTLVIEEIKPSEGYLKNNEVYIRQITAQETGVYVSTYDSPVIPEKVIEIKVKKHQIDTNEGIPGTVFEHTAPDGKRNIVTTDENGEFVLKGLQYGTHTLWEISVMNGYQNTNPIYTFCIDEDTREHLEMVIYNDLAPYELLLYKSDNYNNSLSGAEFSLYEDIECTHEIVSGITDENGELRLSNLIVGKKYYLKETKAPGGYEIPKDEAGKQHVYELYATSTPVKDEFVCYVDGVVYEKVVGTKSHRVVQMELKNEVGYVLPKTGSSLTVLMSLSGVMICGISLCLNKKTKNKK